MKVCRICRTKVKNYDLWTDTVCKWCAQRQGKVIHAYDQRDTSRHRGKK